MITDSQVWQDVNAVFLVTEAKEKSIHFEVKKILGKNHLRQDIASNFIMIKGWVSNEGIAIFNFRPSKNGEILLENCFDVIDLTKIIKRVYDYVAANLASFDREKAKYPKQTKTS